MNLPSVSSLPLWAIAPGYASAVDSQALAPATPRRREKAMGFVIVELTGVLRKPELVAAREQINAFKTNEHVGEIIVLVDSPGGTVAGTHDLHLAIAAAAKVKRVTAVIEDLATSAAYWAIAGATEIVINPTGDTGSLGVFIALVDASKLFERIGIDVIVIRSGSHKGAGIEGAKISPEQIAQLQSVVDAQARHFITAVARGRRMSIDRVRDIADGRILVGEQAIAAGLVDRIVSFEDVLTDAGNRQRALEKREAEARQVADMSPHDCQVRFEELVAEEMQSSEIIDEASAKRLVRSRHPQLAKIAEKLIAEEVRREQEARAWSISHR